MRSDTKPPKISIIRIFVGLAVPIILVGGVFFIATPGRSTSSAKGKVSVVAAENFWGNIASQLGGNYVDVTSIITNPNADPHLYESSAQDAASVASANIVIENGVGYDDFMSKLLNGSPKNSRTTLTAANILGAQENANPHLWYDIPRINLVAAQITNTYISKDPADKSYYLQRLSSFDNSLQPLIQLINQIKQKYAGTPIAYTEPLPGYLLDDAGLNIKTPEGFAKSIEDGDDPSPADTENMYSLMTNHSVKVLLYNAQTVSPVTEHVKQLAISLGIPVIGVTETMPANENSYQSWQQDQLNKILKVLED